MTETNPTRRAALRSFLVFSFAGGLAPLSGCGGEPSYPVIPSDKPKDDLQKDIENPYGAPVKEGKPTKRKR